MILGLPGRWRARIEKDRHAYQYTIYRPDGDAWATGRRVGKDAEQKCIQTVEAVLKRMEGTGYNKINGRKPPKSKH